MISNISCQICLFSFDSIKYLLTHLRDLSSCKLHSGAVYGCPLCGSKCQGCEEFCIHLSNDHANDFNDRIETADETSKKNVNKCSFCAKTFGKPSDLTRHLRTHTNERPFVCNQCGRRFTLKSTLNSHERTHKSARTNEMFKCMFCNRNFLSFSALKLHIRIHTNETPFSCQFAGCQQQFRTKKLMLTHFRHFHDDSREVKSKCSAPCPRKAVLSSLSEISRLESQPLITSQNTAFSQFRKDSLSGEEVSTSSNTSSQVIVIRVQVRSGSVVSGSSIGQVPTDIILEPSTLTNLANHELFMYIALKKTGLPLNLALSVDPRSVLSRLEPPAKETSSSSSHSFTSVVYPTVQHVVSNPPLPFSVLCSEEADLRKIRGHLPSFLIECFLAASHSNDYDVERRQVLAQSCLPMLCNEEGVQFAETNKIPQF